MLLTGTHPRTLDDKKRLALPKRIREQIGEETPLFATPGPDQSLWIYTKDELERLSAKLDQTSATDAEARVFRRLFFAQMEEVELDRTGRILIPDRLVQFAVDLLVDDLRLADGQLQPLAADVLQQDAQVQHAAAGDDELVPPALARADLHRHVGFDACDRAVRGGAEQWAQQCSDRAG